jgi:hypothetical protein
MNHSGFDDTIEIEITIIDPFDDSNMKVQYS